MSVTQADVDEAARVLADILTEERADVLTVYDDNDRMPFVVDQRLVDALGGEHRIERRSVLRLFIKDYLVRCSWRPPESHTAIRGEGLESS